MLLITQPSSCQGSIHLFDLVLTRQQLYYAVKEPSPESDEDAD